MQSSFDTASNTEPAPRIGRHADLDQRGVELMRGSTGERRGARAEHEVARVQRDVDIARLADELVDIDGDYLAGRADFRFAIEKFRQQLLGGRADQWRIFADQGGEGQGAAAVSRLRASGTGNQRQA